MLRQPAVAGAFYPSNPDRLKELIESCFLDDSGVGYVPELESFDGEDYPINVMVPHAGYQYSGPEISVFNEGEWMTPLGNVEVDNEFAEVVIESSDIASSDFMAHIREHSIEVQLPFLQYFSSDFKIVPITMGKQDFVTSNDLSNAIFEAANRLNKSYCVIASTDLSHFNNQEKANKVDGFVLEDIEEMNEFKLFEEVIQYNITMCGYAPVMATMSVSKRCNKTTSEILAYGTSGDVTGDFTSVVGYASGVFR